MKTQRCAMYTRKSTEEGLEQGFNSLHAQREACEAYVMSQAGEGWTAIPTSYDDGGFSGGSMERPGLAALLADIGLGKIDIVVVYKVDRLTRSLNDFSRIVERFDDKAVSFVSVTQAFNTTSSMGRLTLNMLLSFAQFEREVTGERIRDKIAASKAKGLWMGGRPPLGYDGVGRKLVINEAEAQQVRSIFRLYLELGSVVRLARVLADSGERSRTWVDKTDQTVGGTSFRRGGLYYLLSNPVYLGAIRHRQTLYPQAHPAIVDEDTWQAVQSLLASNDVPKPKTRKIGCEALLKGVLVDDAGGIMSPVHTTRRGRRYNYYVSAAAVHGEPRPVGSLHRISAPVLDAFVVDRVKGLLVPAWQPAEATPDRIRAALLQVELGAAQIVIRVKPEALPAGAQESLVISIRLKHRQGVTLISAVDGPPIATPKLDQALVRALALSRRWRSQLEAGQADGIKDLARREKLCPRHTARLAPLGYLAPDLVQQILDGRQPPAMSLIALTGKPLPLGWPEQRRRFASFR